jgi:hypothetical protein
MAAPTSAPPQLPDRLGFRPADESLFEAVDTSLGAAGGRVPSRGFPSVRGLWVQKLIAEIMAASRRAERLASTLPSDSPERAPGKRACDRLRDAYQELTHSGVALQITAAEAQLLLADADSDV